MIDLTRHPRLLKLLSIVDRVRGRICRRRNAAARAEADFHLRQFHRRIWLEAAERLSAEVHDLGNDVLEIRKGDRATRVYCHQTAMDDLVTHSIVRMKPVISRLLAEHGLPVPRYLEFSLADMQPAVAFLESTNGPCVIKPACGTSGGDGVTTEVRGRWQLARAAWLAAGRGDYPVIEEQIAGDNYRLLYLDGELIDAVRRHPPSIVADGKKSVHRMVEVENAARLASKGRLSHTVLSIDRDMRNTLRRQGWSLRSVPPQGTRIQLKTAINENRAEDNVAALADIGPELREQGSLAARLAGVRLAGVDVITPDPSRALHETGGAILEVNSPPGYYWHYCRRGEPFPLADVVLRTLLSAEAGDFQRFSQPLYDHRQMEAT